MERIKQKIQGENNKNTDITPAVKIISGEEYTELFGTESDDESIYGDWSEIVLLTPVEMPETENGQEYSTGGADAQAEVEDLEEIKLTKE